MNNKVENQSSLAQLFTQRNRAMESLSIKGVPKQNRAKLCIKIIGVRQEITTLKCKNDTPNKLVRVFSQNNDSNRNQIAQTGYISHFGPRQEPALFVHSEYQSNTNRMHFVYFKGNTVDDKNAEGKCIEPQFLNETELVSNINNDFRLDLRANGNTGSGPIHLLSCYTGSVSPTTLAAKLARVTNRPVVCYGNNEQIITNNTLELNMSKETRVYRYPLSENNNLNQPLNEIIHYPNNKPGTIRK